MRVAAAGAELAVFETGAVNRPTVILVHGYPDTHAVWDEVVALLADRFHVVTYDLPGIGDSPAPAANDAYALAALAADLRTVAHAVSPGLPVHLVGHDWGAFVCWEALAEEETPAAGDAAPGGRALPFASFTAVAGPRIDDRARWVRRRLRPRPAGLAQIAAQARRSWYVAAIRLPGLAELYARSGGLERSWPAMLRRREGIDPRPGHPAPTLSRDAVAGLALYRTNLSARPPAPAPVRVQQVPVQLIVPTKDRYLSTGFYAESDRWATHLWRRDIRAGHWVQRSHPVPVARAIAELVDHAEGGPEAPPLRRARRARRPHPTTRDRPLAGRLAVVTGAGSGIGCATALALARAGAEVLCADIDFAAAQATAATAAEATAAAKASAAATATPATAATAATTAPAPPSATAPPSAPAPLIPIHLDVSDAAAMERFAAATEAAHGVPDIVVNNAGIGMSGPFLDTTQADWERVLAVNLWGVIHGARLFSRMMVRAGQPGQIINVASAAAYAPTRALPAYATTKAAVLMLSECMRAELAEQGIGVSAICPGFVDTNIVRTARFVGVSAEIEAQRRREGARAYARRGYPPERVADAIVEAIETNPAVVPVTPEARVLLALSKLAPGALRRLARIDR